MESINNPVIPPQILTEIMGSPNDLEIINANGTNNQEEENSDYFELAVCQSISICTFITKTPLHN